MTDTTTARRALLALLLDRVERGALLDSERPLLRPLIAADQDATVRAEQAEDLLRIAHETSNQSEAERAQAVATVARVADALNSLGPLARFHIATALGDTETADDARREAIAGPSGKRWYRGTDGEDMHAAYMDGLAAVARVRALADRLDTGHTGLLTSWGVAAAIREALTGPSGSEPAPTDGPPLAPDDDRAAIIRVRELAERWRYNLGRSTSRDDLLLALDGPSPTPDDAPTAVVDALRAGHTITVDATATSDQAVLDHAIDAAADEIAQQWTVGNGTGQMLGLVGSGVATPVVARCSPLVNPDCPGHTQPPYCDPSPSSFVTMAAVPSWADDEHWPRDHDGPTTEWEQCRARYTADPSIPTGQVDVSVWSPINIRCDREAGHDGPHRESDAPDAIHWEDSVAVYSSADAPSSPPNGTVTDWATRLDEMCPAHYQGDEPRLSEPAQPSVDYRCERRGHRLDSDHAARLRRLGEVVVFSWADAIAVYPVADAPSETADCWQCKHPAHAPGQCTERDGEEHCTCQVGDAPSEQQ